MDTTLDKEENAKNIYVIRRKLATLKSTNSSYYEYDVGGRFSVRMWAKNDGRSCVLNHETIDTNVIEWGPKDDESETRVGTYLDLRTDPRLKDFKPIWYKTFDGPNGTINLGDGKDMPIAHICELIRLLHRLANLTVFS